MKKITKLFQAIVTLFVLILFSANGIENRTTGFHSPWNPTEGSEGSEGSKGQVL